MQGVEFLRRFIQHILPKGFVRIRKYGIYNATTKKSLDLKLFEDKSKFEKLREEKESFLVANKTDETHTCPFCKKGRMIVMQELPRIRSPAGHLPTLLNSYLY